MTEPNDILKHFGIKGMHWGVRRSLSKDKTPDGETHATQPKPGTRVVATGGRKVPASQDALSVARSKQKVKNSTIDSLTTKELQEMVNRMNLEQQYSKLTAPQGKQGIAKGKAKVDEYLSYADTYNKVMNLPGMKEARNELIKDLGIQDAAGKIVTKIVKATAGR